MKLYGLNESAVGGQLILLAFFFLILQTSDASTDPASGDFDCAAYDAEKEYRKSLSSRRGCVQRLSTDPEDYEECRDSTNTTCYIFLQEPPFVKFSQEDFAQHIKDTRSTEIQKPFRCGQYVTQFRDVKRSNENAQSFGGIAMQLHKRTSSATDYCIWGGHLDDCSFNQLVDFIEVAAKDGYRFAITGLLLEIPRRQCNHIASAPLVDNSMVIIGNKDQGAQSTFKQLSQPFEAGSWILFLLSATLIIVIALYIAIRYRRGRSIITAFFFFVGDRDQAIKNEEEKRSATAAENARFARNYSCVMIFLRFAFIFLLAIFAFFYEVSVTNFLFIAPEELPKRISGLSGNDLSRYSILRDSALENVWKKTVKKDDPVPWEGNRCGSANECFEIVNTSQADFVVSFEVVGKYLMLQEEKRCTTMKLFKLQDQDALYQFNGGWLYNQATYKEKRMLVDRELVGLRIEGETTKIIERELEGFSVCEFEGQKSLRFGVIWLPLLLFVGIPFIIAFSTLLCGQYSSRFFKKRNPAAS